MILLHTVIQCLFGRRAYAFVGSILLIIGMFLGCVPSTPKEPTLPDEPTSDLPVAPAASVAPEPPMNVETFELTPEVEKPAKKRSNAKPAKKKRTKPRKK